MRKFSLFISITITLMMSSCLTVEKSETTKAYTPTTQIIHHDYNEVQDRMILWGDIFTWNDDLYYVYFFSRTCGHCEKNKDFIIEKALGETTIYFCESSKETKITTDVSGTIGLDSIETFGILGFPSLVKIVSKKVVSNVAGISEITKILSS